MTDAPHSYTYYKLARSFLWVFFKTWNRFTSRGAKNVPHEGACILAANHASYLDPPVVGAGCLHRPLRFVARDTLFKPGFGEWFFHKVSCIPLDREKGDIGAIRSVLAALKTGGAVGLFPEGTRSLDGDFQQAKPGIGLMVAKANVPVIPVYVEGTFEAYPKGAGFIRPSRIRVTYGEPIRPEEVAALGKGRTGYEQVGALIMERIAALKDA